MWPVGGSVLYPLSGSPIPAGATITIDRMLPLTQVTSLDNQGNQYPATIEAALDTLCMQIQQVNQIAQLSLQIPITDTVGTDTLLPSAQMRASNLLAFDAVGNPIVISPSAIAAGGLSYYDNLVLSGSAQTSPIAYVSLSAVGPDPSIGINHFSKGTTTNNNQFNGVSGGPYTTGTHDFYLNNVKAVSITDIYFNPSTYSPIDGGIILSSGSSQGGTETSVVFSAAIFNSLTATSATARVNAMGLIGEIHFVNNGYVSASVTSNINPNGNNHYADSYWIGLSGAAHGTGIGPSVSIQSSDGTFSDNFPLLFYQAGTGGFSFGSDNTATVICTMNRVANAINALQFYGAASGNSPMVATSGGAGNIRLSLSGTDDAGVDICNRLGAFKIASFNAGFSPANHLIFTAGSGAVISTSGGDLRLTSGTGFVAYGTFVGTPATSAGYIIWKDDGGTQRKIMIGT